MVNERKTDMRISHEILKTPKETLYIKELLGNYWIQIFKMYFSEMKKGRQAKCVHYGYGKRILNGFSISNYLLLDGYNVCLLGNI